MTGCNLKLLAIAFADRISTCPGRDIKGAGAELGKKILRKGSLKKRIKWAYP
jgi:hypothetical protein